MKKETISDHERLKRLIKQLANSSVNQQDFMHFIVPEMFEVTDILIGNNISWKEFSEILEKAGEAEGLAYENYFYYIQDLIEDFAHKKRLNIAAWNSTKKIITVLADSGLELHEIGLLIDATFSEVITLAKKADLTITDIAAYLRLDQVRNSSNIWEEVYHLINSRHGIE